MYLDVDMYIKEEQPMVNFLNNNYEYCYLESMHYFNKKYQNVTSIITGLSYGLDGLESRLLKGNVINFSMHSQDLYYDYLHIKKAVENSGETIKNCIITLGYYSLYYDLSLSNNEWKCYKTYMPLFSDIHHSVFEEAVLPSFSCMDKYRQFYHSFFQEKRSYYGEAILREHTSISISKRGGWLNLNTDERDREAYELAQKHNRHLKHRDTFMENKIILGNMIQFLTEKNIRPIITVLPFSREYLRYIDGTYKEELLSVLDEVSCGVNLDFIDLNDTDFFGEDELLDCDHLNSRGALKATMVMNGVLSNLF